MVLDGLGQDMVSFTKYWVARCTVSGRTASSRKYGRGWSGSGPGRFDKGLNREIGAFLKGC